MSGKPAEKKEPGVHAGHRQRLKERFQKEGLDNFQPHVVLELLLFYAIPQRDTNEIAHSLLKKFGSLSGVLNADIEDLMTVDYIGESAATLLKMVPDLARRYLDDCDAKSLTITSIEELGDFLKPKFIGRTKEMVYLLGLDSRGRVVLGDFIIEGTIDFAPMYVRSILEAAMKSKAVSVVLAHNHPNGLALPSNADLAATVAVHQALSVAKIKLMDHIIVAGSDYVSLRDSGFFCEL